MLKCVATPSARPAVSLSYAYDQLLLSHSCQNLKMHADASGAFQPIMEGKFEKEIFL